MSIHSRAALLTALALAACGGSHSPGVSPLSGGELPDAMARTSSSMWAMRAPLPQGRDAVLVAAVRDELFAAAGDNATGLVRPTYAYSAATNHWYQRPVIPIGVSGASIGVITAPDGFNGTVYVVGGGGATVFFAVRYVQAYDSATNTWALKTPLPQARLAPAVATLGHTLYVIGGADSHGNPTNTMFAYDPETNAWTTRAPLPVNAYEASAAVVGSTLYVVGAISANDTATYAYNATANAWSARADSPKNATFAGAAVVKGQIYVVGGQDQNGLGGKSNAVQVYNPATNAWHLGPSLPYGVNAEGVAALHDTLYEVGGQNGLFQDIATMNAL